MRTAKMENTKMLVYALHGFVCSVFFLTSCGASDEVNSSYIDSGPSTENATVDNNLLLYQRLYRTKRKEQQEMANSLMAVDDFAKQYTVLSRLTVRMIDVFKASNATVNASGFIPGVTPFPNNTQEDLREAVANIVENVVLFGDLALRCPDAMDEVFRVHKAKKWRPLIEWAHSFTNESAIVTGSDTEVIRLMAQELKLSPPDGKYQNPYRKPKMSTAEWEKLRKEKAQKEKEAKRAEKKKKRRGPRISGEL
ncbi:coiled-coil domain-containing protein 134-like [Sycon ciliatum]|uniref:coiled-coil domain-containing protein 134-like n=1 Tax=Sycon ciliatum TaxID=27933 RepID=UPI0031F6D41A